MEEKIQDTFVSKQIVKFISKPILRIILCPISILFVPPEKKSRRSSIFTKQRTSTEGGRQLIRKKGDEQTGCSFLPLVDKSYEGAVNMRTLVLHLVGRLRNIDGASRVRTTPFAANIVYRPS